MCRATGGQKKYKPKEEEAVTVQLLVLLWCNAPAVGMAMGLLMRKYFYLIYYILPFLQGDQGDVLFLPILFYFRFSKSALPFFLKWKKNFQGSAAILSFKKG